MLYSLSFWTHDSTYCELHFQTKLDLNTYIGPKCAEICFLSFFFLQPISQECGYLKKGFKKDSTSWCNPVTRLWNESTSPIINWWFNITGPCWSNRWTWHNFESINPKLPWGQLLDVWLSCAVSCEEVAVAPANHLLLRTCDEELRHGGACAASVCPGINRGVTTHLEPSPSTDRENER